MSLVREKDLYEAYCNLCFYTDTTPLSHDKWKKQFRSAPTKQNRTVDNIKRELEEIRERV